MTLASGVLKRIYAICLGIRYKTILLLINDMPVIVNCTVDTTVIEKNMVDSSKCICYNNKVIKPRYHYDTPVQQDNSRWGKVSRQGNAFYLTI
jgi:hypothetical protein